MSSARNSILCPNCRKLISRDESSCPYCGLIQPALHSKAGKLRNIFFAFGPVKTIIAVNIVFFALSLILYPQDLFSGGSPFRFLSPSNQSLLLLGATGTFPVLDLLRLWTLVSASFLHGGIIHLGFNMMALYQIGPFVLREYGVHRFVNLYILTGVVGFAVSVLAGVRFTIGASACICGLIGAIIYYGKSRGGSYGEAIFKQTLGWVVGLIILGFLFPGINNWAHGGGLAAGIALGWAMGYNDQKPESAWVKLLAYACILISAGILLWACLSAILIRVAAH